MTLGSPPSRTVTTLLVVPRSMPTVRAMVNPPLTACPGRRFAAGEAGSALSRLHSWSTGRGGLSIPSERHGLNFFSAEDSGQSHGRRREVARRERALAKHPHPVVLRRGVGPAPAHAAELVRGPGTDLHPGRGPVTALPEGHRETRQRRGRAGADEVRSDNHGLATSDLSWRGDREAG